MTRAGAPNRRTRPLLNWAMVIMPTALAANTMLNRDGAMP